MSDESKRQYFASLKPALLAAEILDRVEEFDRHLVSSGRAAVWSRAHSYYNMAIYKDARINRTGESAELTEISVNHFRNLLTHMINMTTNQRPSFDCRSANTDFKSQAQTIVGNGILEYYDRFKGLDAIARTSVEDVVTLADGYVTQLWDFSLGEAVMPDPRDPTETRQIKQGDVQHKNYTPQDVIFDFKAGQRQAARQWYCIRDFQNKWDLAARYPELRDKIIRHSEDSTQFQYAALGGAKSDADQIPVFIFMHDRTDAMPNGRYFTFISKDVWFVDSDLPKFYKKMPIYRICAAEQRGTGFGYSIGFDLLPIQEGYNALCSIILSNQSTFGVQNILMPTGSNIDVEELADGMNLINYDPKLGKPEAMNLTHTPEEIFKFMELLGAALETVSGINSVQRGNPEASLKSGSALALVQSMAIQFLSGLEKSYAALLEDLGNGLIHILKECATSPRIVEIAGKTQRAYVKEFTKKDISSLSRVTVDLGNPVARTTAGKVNMADQLMGKGLIKTPEEYIQVLTTGKLEPAIEGQQAELMLIRSENEAMSEGKPVIAVAVDNHHIHIAEHKCVIASPEARQDPAIVTAVLNHITQHIELLRTTDPFTLQMIGEVPPPPMTPGAAGPGGETMPPTGNPTTAEAAKVQQPGLPENPLTQETVTLNGG